LSTFNAIGPPIVPTPMNPMLARWGALDEAVQNDRATRSIRSAGRHISKYGFVCFGHSDTKLKKSLLSSTVA
jgi:hypothetical protein